MGKIVEFPSGDNREGREKEQGEFKTQRLTQREFLSLIEPLKEGLKRLYPSQVKDVLGIAGFGEKCGNEIFVVGILIWVHYKQEAPIASTFLAVFINEKLEKISFIEAKNNYWDWRLMLETYQTRFHTKEMFQELQALREQLLSGNQE